jgi:hypothetical protein
MKEGAVKFYNSTGMETTTTLVPVLHRHVDRSGKQGGVAEEVIGDL